MFIYEYVGGWVSGCVCTYTHLVYTYTHLGSPHYTTCIIYYMHTLLPIPFLSFPRTRPSHFLPLLPCLSLSTRPLLTVSPPFLSSPLRPRKDVPFFAALCTRSHFAFSELCESSEIIRLQSNDPSCDCSGRSRDCSQTLDRGALRP